MKRNELQNELKKLGFNNLCDDNKTLVAYNEIQHFLYDNKTPIKAVSKVYLRNNILRVVLYNKPFNDFEICDKDFLEIM